MVLWPKFTAMF